MDADLRAAIAAMHVDPLAQPGAALRSALRVVDAQDRLPAVILADLPLGDQMREATSYLVACSDLAVAEAWQWNRRAAGGGRAGK